MQFKRRVVGCGHPQQRGFSAATSPHPRQSSRTSRRSMPAQASPVVRHRRSMSGLHAVCDASWLSSSAHNDRHVNSRSFGNVAPVQPPEIGVPGPLDALCTFPGPQLYAAWPEYSRRKVHTGRAGARRRVCGLFRIWRSSTTTTAQTIFIPPPWPNCQIPRAPAATCHRLKRASAAPDRSILRHASCFSTRESFRDPAGAPQTQSPQSALPRGV